MNAWAPVVQTLIWVAFLSTLLYAGRAQVSSIATALRDRVAAGAGIKATGPVGLSLELTHENAQLTPVPPAGTQPSGGLDAARPEWTEDRATLGKNQRSVHIAHTLAPSKIAGQEFDIYVYLVGWGRDRFGLPTDLRDVAKAEFYMGPAFGDQVIDATMSLGKIGFRTSAYAPALCLCRLTFTDGATAILSRYLDFEMGNAVSRTAWEG